MIRVSDIRVSFEPIEFTAYENKTQKVQFDHRKPVNMGFQHDVKHQFLLSGAGYWHGLEGHFNCIPVEDRDWSQTNPRYLEDRNLLQT